VSAAWLPNVVVMRSASGRVASIASSSDRNHRRRVAASDRSCQLGERVRSLDEAIDATRPEALLITTTLGSHAALTRAALDAGLHVLVEKPFVETLERAQALV